MAIEVRMSTVVLPGGKIELSTPELIPGQHATVVITVENGKPEQPQEQLHVIDILKALPGRRIFQTAEDIDAYIRQERDSWDH